ncbi:MAG TPA: large conductance mechanosensitive channel protein MscL [Patescibacteria group bacterium]|nr:large conductance mechanosensitive channel protein MscL [Patescibacteria group bacterium]
MEVMHEFKKFITRGSVVDLATGVIIGASFSKIVTSLVEDIIMPPLGLIVGKVDFSNFFIPLSHSEKEYHTVAAAKAAGVSTWNIGNFGNTLFQFLLVAFAVFFFIIKPLNKFKAKEAAKPVAPPAPSRSEELLQEIRDLLKTKA